MDELLSGVAKIAAELPFYDPTAASLFLKGLGDRASVATLAKLRCRGGGPRFEYFGRFPRYRQDWLVEYVMSRRSGPKKSTSEAGRQKKPRRASVAVAAE